MRWQHAEGYLAKAIEYEQRVVELRKEQRNKDEAERQAREEEEERQRLEKEREEKARRAAERKKKKRRSRSRSRSWRSSSFSRSPYRIAENVTAKNYHGAAHRKAITASVKFMKNHELCCVVLEGTGEVLCRPPVEYIKSWSTVLHKSVDSESNFKVKVRDDGTREITISHLQIIIVA